VSAGARLRSARPGPAVRPRPVADCGYSVLELLFVVGIGMTASAVAVPQVLAGLDDVRTSAAARYLSTRLQRARMEAVMRSTNVAIQFTGTESGYEYAVYVDGNGNGVLTMDIQSGIDRRVGAVESLRSQFTGVDFGAIAGLPPVDPGGTPPGADPIRLGASSLASFSAIGSSSSGTVYIRGRGDSQYAVRILGETGKTRMMKFNRHTRRWSQL
jgi:type II secretory pathway pseudopilin PulG